jgi:CarD family transcriptional regulator, regulator of rRNA transcription
MNDTQSPSLEHRNSTCAVPALAQRGPDVWCEVRIDGRSGNLEVLPVPADHVRSAQRMHREFCSQGRAGARFARSNMAFDVGDKVVYPHHGAATIEKREKKEAFGEKRDYLVLRLAYGDLTLMVPADNAEEIGLRDVINDEEVEEVFAVLRKKEARMPTNWSRRFKNHVEKLKSGDIYQVAEVVRNLSIREADKGLSAGEKRMLARARQILVSELTFALNVDEESAEARLDAVLKGEDEPPAPKKAKAPAKKKAAAKS